MKDMKKFEVFVAKNGNDSNTGAIDSPLATINAARKRVRKYCKDGYDVSVNIRGGEYFVERGIYLSCEDSASRADTPITYRAYNGEDVTFVGGRAVPAEKISRVTDSEVLSRIIDKNARERLLQIDLSDYMDIITDNFRYEHRRGFPNRFYMNGKAMEIARFPKRGDDRNVWGPYLSPTLYETDERAWRMYVCDTAKKRMRLWDKRALDGLWVHGYFVHDWADANIKVSAADADGGWVEMTQIQTYQPKSGNAEKRRYYFFNVLDELSKTGEYYIDFDKKLMYFVPEEGCEAPEIVIPVLDDPMFTVDIDAVNIKFEGLRFAYTHAKVFAMTDAQHITIENCEFVHGNQVAIKLRRAFNITIRGCHFYDYGCGAVQTEFVGERFKDRKGNLLIENCRFHEIAQGMHCYTGINIGWESSGITIRGCEIYDTPHTLIYAFNSSDILIENNNLYNAVRDVDDSGAIYWQMSSSNLGTVIRNNYIHDCGNAGAHWGTSALYADGGTGADVYNNIFENVCEGCEDKVEFTAVKCHSESFSHIHNNIFIGGNRIYSLGTWDHQYNYGIAEWITEALGAYTLTSYPAQRQYDNLTAAGFFCDYWMDKYKGTIWEKMYDYLTPENICKVQSLKRQLKAEGLSDEIITGRLRLLAADLGWNHKMPDGSIYEGSFWDCVKNEFPDVYNAALADVEGKSEEERLYRLFRLSLEMYWYKHLIPTDCVWVYDNVCVGALDKYIGEDGKMKLGYMVAESELLLKDAKIDGELLFSEGRTLNQNAVAHIKERLSGFESFSCKSN